MPYNYATAFAPPVHVPTKQQLSEITVAALIVYSTAFPAAENMKFSIYCETKHIELSAEGYEPRLYSWKELGFEF